MDLQNTSGTNQGSILWHPHQKLWNWRLVDALSKILPFKLGKKIIQIPLVGLDTIFLWTRVLYRRVALVGLLNFYSSQAGIYILHIDCGVHRAGLQIRKMHEWFGKFDKIQIIGFEASKEHYQKSKELENILSNTSIFNAALTPPDYNEKKIKLYKSGGSGIGDSLFSERGNMYEIVDAKRLSDFLSNYDLDDRAVILRMNVEGSELGIIEDLLSANMIQKIDGYYGMWDDLSKINPQKDAIFRKILRENGIRNLTFNDRDHKVPFRLAAIKFDIGTTLIRAKRRYS